MNKIDHFFFIFIAALFCSIHFVRAQVDNQEKKVTINFGALKNNKSVSENIPPKAYKIKNKDFDVSIPELELPDTPILLSPKAKENFDFKSNLDLEGFGTLKPKEIAFGKAKETNKYITNQKPRFLKEFEGGKAAVFTDQDLGNIITSSQFVIIRFKDYGRVDGDLIRLLVNDEIKIHRISLNGSFSQVKLSLKEGFNKIDFLAINVGLYAPNTAQLKITDDRSEVLHNNQWALSTGFKATIVVIKE